MHKYIRLHFSRKEVIVYYIFHFFRGLLKLIMMLGWFKLILIVVLHLIILILVLIWILILNLILIVLTLLLKLLFFISIHWNASPLMSFSKVSRLFLRWKRIVGNHWDTLRKNANFGIVVVIRAQILATEGFGHYVFCGID